MLQITMAMPSRRPGHRRPARHRHGEPATLGPNTRNHRGLPSRSDRGRERQHPTQPQPAAMVPRDAVTARKPRFSEDRERSDA